MGQGKEDTDYSNVAEQVVDLADTVEPVAAMGRWSCEDDIYVGSDDAVPTVVVWRR